MSARHFWIAVVFLITVMPAFLVAQDEKNEIGGAVGRTFISDQGINANFPGNVIHFGKGVTVEAEYARHFYVAPLYALTGEVVGAYNPDIDLNGGSTGFAVVPNDYKVLFVTPAARLNLFPLTAVSPWVSFGGGVGHFGESKYLDFGGLNPGKSTTTGVIEGGFGLDVKLWSRLGFRLHVRDFWSGEPDLPLALTGKTRQHNYFVGGGAFWRF
jgi:hypothetical protein